MSAAYLALSCASSTAVWTESAPGNTCFSTGWSCSTWEGWKRGWWCRLWDVGWEAHLRRRHARWTAAGCAEDPPEPRPFFSHTKHAQAMIDAVEEAQPMRCCLAMRSVAAHWNLDTSLQMNVALRCVHSVFLVHMTTVMCHFVYFCWLVTLCSGMSQQY